MEVFCVIKDKFDLGPSGPFEGISRDVSVPHSVIPGCGGGCAGSMIAKGSPHSEMVDTHGGATVLS